MHARLLLLLLRDETYVYGGHCLAMAMKMNFLFLLL